MKWLQESYYHVYNRAVSNDRLYISSYDYNRFILLFNKHLLPAFEIHAYCILPNHFHFLLRTHPVRVMDPDRVYSKSLSNLCNAYAQYFNKRHGRKGSLFMRPFKSKLITQNHHYSKIIHYIHANPLHHGLVLKISDWMYCSYHSLIANSQTDLQRTYVLEWFGGRNKFIDFHNQPIGIKKDGIYLESWTP